MEGKSGSSIGETTTADFEDARTILIKESSIKRNLAPELFSRCLHKSQVIQLPGIREFCILFHAVLPYLKWLV